jgi:beta-lactamase class A
MSPNQSSKSIVKIVLLLFLMSGCNSKNITDEIGYDVVKMFADGKGKFAVAFKDLQTGEQLLINAHKNFHAASTMKTPVMIEVYKQAAAGKFAMSDSVIIKNEFASILDGSAYSLDVGDDTEADLYKNLGKKRTIADLTYDMIIVSSNLATNLIIEYVDAKNVTQTMRDLGAPDIHVLRGVEDQKAFDAGLSNSTTAYDLMVIFEKIAKGEAVSATASEAMINTLLDQKYNDIIPVHLPKDVKVAHKTGSITGVHHDSGIVFLPDGRKYSLVLLSKELEDFDEGTALLARVSEMVYNYMMD